MHDGFVLDENRSLRLYWVVMLVVGHAVVARHLISALSVCVAPLSGDGKKRRACGSPKSINCLFVSSLGQM